MIVVTGVSGSGKSTLADAAVEALGKPWKVVNFGRTMVQEAKRPELASDPETLRAQDMATYRRVMLDACDVIASGDEETVLDSRCLIASSRGYLPGLPAEILLNLAPRSLVLVEGDPGEILARRKKNTEKPWYGKQGEAEVTRQQELARAYAVAASFASGAPLCVLVNRDGAQEETTQRLVRALTEGVWEIDL
jgi:adenylate kinase